MSASVAAGDTAGEDLLVTSGDGIVRITFNRPQARNALTFAMYEGVAATCRQVNDDPSVRAVILAGAGDKAFASGTDISQFRAFDKPEDAIAYEARIDRVLVDIERCRVPVIAAISGACMGGGAAIAACCDLRIGTATAKFGFPIARTLGNCLSTTNIARLVSLIGPARVKDIIFLARPIGAEEALSIGLLTEMVPDAEALARRTEEVARTISGHAPLTLRATKEAVRRLATPVSPEAERDLILMCYMSRDFREGMEAFLAKRPPNWTGE